MPKKRTEKKTISITIRLTQSDYDRLQQAAAKLWPRAEMTDTARLWGVARIGIDEALHS